MSSGNKRPSNQSLAGVVARFEKDIAELKRRSAKLSEGTQGPEGPPGPSGTWALAQTIDTKTSSYTLLTADTGKLITVNSSAAVDITVDGSLDLNSGERIDIMQIGSGQVTVVASGATVNATPTLKFRAQYSAATLICISSDNYVLVGDLAAS